MERTAEATRINRPQEYRIPAIMQFLFLLYIFVKPFYIFESGSFQPGDVVFVASFVAFLYYNVGTNLIFCKADYILFIFLALVALINFIYFTLYHQTEFIKSTLYYVFNFLLVIVGRYLFLDKDFIKRLFWVCRAGIYFQVILKFIGLGRYYYDEASGMLSDRYEGTLNDPNQLAFFIFSLLMIMFIIENFSEIGCRTNVLDYVAFIYIVFATSSTGMLLALVTFGVSYLAILMITAFFERDSEKRSRLLWIWAVIIIALIIFLINKDYFIAEMNKSELFARLLEKETLTTSTSGSTLAKASIWQDRNIDKVYLYPIYNIFGAGQGYFQRFWHANSSGEVHSTLLSILFCYGIIPTVLFLYWVWQNVKRTTIYFFPVFTALAVESITLLNQRQPTFWIMFLLAYSYKIMEDRKYEDAFHT